MVRRPYCRARWASAATQKCEVEAFQDSPSLKNCARGQDERREAATSREKVLVSHEVTAALRLASMLFVIDRQQTEP
jgi:hypothetical protein